MGGIADKIYACTYTMPVTGDSPLLRFIRVCSLPKALWNQSLVQHVLHVHVRVYICIHVVYTCIYIHTDMIVPLVLGTVNVCLYRLSGREMH